MSYKMIGIAIAASLLGAAAMAQTTSPADKTGSAHMSKNGAMASSAGHQKMTKMDQMMVKNCKAMPAAKMAADKECQDYMKNHPDWMKTKK